MKQKSTYWQSPIPTSFSHYSLTVSFIDRDEFVAMKTLSGCKAPRCDKDQFHDNMTVSTSTVLHIYITCVM